MDQIYPYGASVFLILIGLISVMFRRQFARRIMRQNKSLYDQVPTAFSPRADQITKQRELVHEIILAIAGAGLVAAGIFNLGSLVT
jgi:hypothetical protein